MISPFKSDDAAPLGEIAGDFHPIFHCLGAAVAQEDLFRKISRNDVVQLLSQGNIGLVHHQVEAGVDVFSRLIPYGLDHRVGAMTHIQNPHPAGKIDVLPSGYILYPGPVSFGYDEGSHVEYPPWKELLLFPSQLLHVIQ